MCAALCDIPAKVLHHFFLVKSVPVPFPSLTLLLQLHPFSCSIRNNTVLYSVYACYASVHNQL